MNAKTGFTISTTEAGLIVLEYQDTEQSYRTVMSADGAMNLASVLQSSADKIRNRENKRGLEAE